MIEHYSPRTSSLPAEGSYSSHDALTVGGLGSWADVPLQFATRKLQLAIGLKLVMPSSRLPIRLLDCIGPSGLSVYSLVFRGLRLGARPRQ